MDRIKATPEEVEMARKVYGGQNDDEVKLEISNYAEDGLADDPIFQQALLDAQFKARMKKELAVPAERYTKKHQQDTNELMLNVAKRYDCNLAEAFIKLVEFPV